jgi:hypothetical protein
VDASPALPICRAGIEAGAAERRGAAAGADAAAGAERLAVAAIIAMDGAGGKSA